MRVLVIQHVACEGPGWYREALDDAGAQVATVQIAAGEPLPSLTDFDALIVMGGPMGVYDEDELPWLAEERKAISEALVNHVPIWGVCLGAQLLAAAAGARVFSGPAPEVGVGSVVLTSAAAEDPVFGGVIDPLAVLHWHGDTFELPPDALLLAGSEAYPHQAFRLGERAYGLQFHLEVSAEMAAEWLTIPAYAESLERALGARAADPMLAELERAAAAMREHAHLLFNRWLNLA